MTEKIIDRLVCQKISRGICFADAMLPPKNYHAHSQNNRATNAVLPCKLIKTVVGRSEERTTAVKVKVSNIKSGPELCNAA